MTLREDGLLLKSGGAVPEGRARVRIVVGKKVAKLAVQRNRIRRVLREALRKELAAGPSAGHEFTLIVLPGFAAVKRLQAQYILRRLLGKAFLPEQ